MNTLPTYPLMKDKDQNLVVRLKDFENSEWIDWSKSLKVFCYQREKTRPEKPQVRHVRIALTC